MERKVQSHRKDGKDEEIKSRYWIWSFVFFVILFGFALYYFSEIRKGLLMMKRVNIYWLFIALATQFATYFFTALVYFSLLKAFQLKTQPRLWDLIKASIILLFFNQTIPSAGVSGNTFFFKFLTRYHLSRAKSISLILVELLVFYAAMIVIILSLLMVCLFVYPSFGAFKGTLAAGLAVYLIFGAVIIFAGRNNAVNRILEKILHSRIVKWIYKVLKRSVPDDDFSKSSAHMLEVFRHRTKIVQAFCFHLLVISADSFTLYVLFRGIGYPISPLIVLLSLISTRIIAILPFLPGALVLYEGSMSFFLSSSGVPIGTAFVVVMVYRILSFWIPIPAGTFLFRRWVKQEPSPAGLHPIN